MSGKLSPAQQRTLRAISRGAHWGRALERYDYASGDEQLAAPTISSLLHRQLIVLASADRYARHGTIALTAHGRRALAALPAEAALAD
jgi:hypothetical protein